jgi:hypothetical protein
LGRIWYSRFSVVANRIRVNAAPTLWLALIVAHCYTQGILDSALVVEPTRLGREAPCRVSRAAPIQGVLGRRGCPCDPVVGGES